MIEGLQFGAAESGEHRALAQSLREGMRTASPATCLSVSLMILGRSQLRKKISSNPASPVENTSEIFNDAPGKTRATG